MEMKLTIKRVPTVVSNYQEDAAATAGERPRAGCGRDCLGDCCLPGEPLPPKLGLKKLRLFYCLIITPWIPKSWLQFSSVMIFLIRLIRKMVVLIFVGYNLNIKFIFRRKLKKKKNKNIFATSKKVGGSCHHS